MDLDTVFVMKVKDVKKKKKREHVHTLNLISSEFLFRCLFPLLV